MSEASRATISPADKALQRVVDAGFDDPRAVEFGDRYLELLLARTSDVYAALRRTALMIITAAVAFELLVGADVQEFALGPFKVSDVSFAPALLPPLISFALYELYMSLVANLRLRKLRIAVVRKLYPSLHRYALVEALAPVALSPIGFDEWRRFRFGRGGKARALADGASAVTAVALLLAPFAYLVYAYWRIFDTSSASTAVVWGGLAVTLLNVFRVAATLADETEAL